MHITTNFECDWLIELCDNKLSNSKLFNNKLSDNNLASAFSLVERTLKRFFLNQSQSRKLYFFMITGIITRTVVVIIVIVG